MVGISEIARDFAKEAGITQTDAKKSIMFVFDKISEYLAKDEDVKIHNFGVFKNSLTAARKVQNLQTKERVELPETIRLKFVTSKALKEKIHDEVDIEHLRKRLNEAKARRAKPAAAAATEPAAQ